MSTSQAKLTKNNHLQVIQTEKTPKTQQVEGFKQPSRHQRFWVATNRGVIPSSRNDFGYSGSFAKVSNPV